MGYPIEIQCRFFALGWCFPPLDTIPIPCHGIVRVGYPMSFRSIRPERAPPQVRHYEVFFWGQTPGVYRYSHYFIDWIASVS